MSTHKEFTKVTTKALQLMKAKNKKISALTAYDYTTANLVDSAGIDLILVGDSVSNVFQGNDTTLPVTLDEMIYHTKAVAKGINRAMLVVDMPFMTYETNMDEAFRNAGRILKETHAGAVKLEGGERMAETINKITGYGIPVMGHIGLVPQSIHKFGSYKARGTNEEEANEILKDAKILEEAGVFALVIEKVPAELAKNITESINIPTIGIGAGPFCDGQILVINDMLGLSTDFNPRFVRRYNNLADHISSAVKSYIEDVRSSSFPNESESY
ncbi:MAG: 3-methyl-2-oxobutanoate hydroxymethyltransferase [Melioribacteraceae bacterium]|nr:3-methyl-2-oxobutanoate hydroxymethyltransferase [Melioribacteraceae bacterium]MCF8264050.1 3-methyl-2-oxobutanoate hydroxymethyltransferase [Melioribacteraceae bacterium]MCF8411862.1 3-methyl-2-oxobutanoate hydroxymethyltransferase [Melioribacteraceae bacterium]MCF8431495.1 3-methyl-2-oxobutanoate hydroxymethyltransferase [Melioribacteraceae bacterium]